MSEYNPTVEEIKAKLTELESEFKAKGVIARCIRCSDVTEAYEILICDKCIAESKAARVRRQARLN